MAKCFRKAKFFVSPKNDREEVVEEEQVDELNDFPGYDIIDDDVLTCELRNIDNIANDELVDDRNEDNDEDGVEEDMEDTPSLTAGLDSIHDFRKLLGSFTNSEDLLEKLNRVENFLSREVFHAAYVNCSNFH